MANMCKGGCAIPVNYVPSTTANLASPFLSSLTSATTVTVDPFLEFDENGFRGGGEGLTCGRSCASLASATLSTAEQTAYTYFCSNSGQTNGVNNLGGTAAGWGFSRGYVDDKAIAPAGAYYWWNGAPQTQPNVDYQTAALEYAQTAYFITIIIVQWADLMIAKTRKLSIFEQGMGNDFMNFGLIFETVLGATLCYTPIFNKVFGTRPLHVLHWFSGVPWSILIFTYDELRKSLIRSNPKGWLDRWTYW
jgi:sodium/potassium-transporting ATPase subunit alpha